MVRATGFGRDQIARLLAAARAPASFEEPAGDDRDDAVADHVQDGDAQRAFDRVLDAIEFREVQDLTDGLAERERTVLRAHYGLGTPAQTLQQIGQGLGLTAERARQIESGALHKLRSALSQAAPGSGTM